MSRDVRQEVIEGTMLATLAQLRSAVQRAADATERANATEQAATALLVLVSEALVAALPGATTDAVALVADATRGRFSGSRCDARVAQAQDALLATVPPALRDALRAVLTAPTDHEPVALGDRRDHASSRAHDPESEDPCSTE